MIITRKLLSLLLLVNLSTNSTMVHASKVAQGLYVGVDLDVARLSVKEARSFVLTIPFDPSNTFNLEQSVTQVGENDGISGTLSLGYSKGWDSFIIGLEGRANLVFSHLKTSLNVEVQDVYESVNIAFTSSAQLKNMFAVVGQAGFLLQDNTWIYGLAGPSWGNFDLATNGFLNLSSLVESTAQYNKFNHYALGLLVGLGVGYAILPQAKISLEYNYNNYFALSFPSHITGEVTLDGGSFPEASTFIEEQFKASASAVFLKFSYVFVSI